MIYPYIISFHIYPYIYGKTCQGGKRKSQYSRLSCREGVRQCFSVSQSPCEDSFVRKACEDDEAYAFIV